MKRRFWRYISESVSVIVGFDTVRYLSTPQSEDAIWWVRDVYIRVEVLNCAADGEPFDMSFAPVQERD